MASLEERFNALVQIVQNLPKDGNYKILLSLRKFAVKILVNLI